MTKELRRALGAAAVLGLVGGTSAAQAQADRKWVDPPPQPEKVETPPAPQSPPPQNPPPQASAAPPPSAAPSPTPAAASQPARPAETEKASPRPQRRLVRAKRKTETAERRAPERRARAVASDQPRRERTIREGGAQPLEVMNLRTIEFPDGRRVQILTRPERGAVSEFLGQ